MALKNPHIFCKQAWAEIPNKISLIFWEIWRHQKDILNLTDLYVVYKVYSEGFSAVLMDLWGISRASKGQIIL